MKISVFYDRKDFFGKIDCACDCATESSDAEYIRAALKKSMNALDKRGSGGFWVDAVRIEPSETERYIVTRSGCDYQNGVYNVVRAFDVGRITSTEEPQKMTRAAVVKLTLKKLAEQERESA